MWGFFLRINTRNYLKLKVVKHRKNDNIILYNIIRLLVNDGDFNDH